MEWNFGLRLTLNNMKRYVLVLFSLILAFSFGGCSLVPSVELTEIEQKVIAEYAAGLLLKYDKNYRGALQDIEEDEDDGLGFVQNEEAKLPVSEELTEDDTALPEQPEFDEDLMASEQTVDAETPEYADISIAEAIGLDSFDVIYKSYETHNIFPEEESDELVFSMQAQNGMELLVVNFGITNDSGDRRLCDVLNSDASFRLLINGSERISANKTILLNDLGSYSEEIDGYAMADAVLVFEVAEGTSSNIDRLDLVVKKADVSTTHMLK